MSAAQLPWIVPVPVRRSDFTPLRPADAACNVEVELGRIGAFAHRRRPLPEHALLFADLQLNPDVNANRRFGSGRAGVHAGRYVKGVGRTLLAGNWNDPDDLYHNSGLQLASAGVRELLVSEYLRREGLGRVIVPCEGLLARRLPVNIVTIKDLLARLQEMLENLRTAQIQRGAMAFLRAEYTFLAIFILVVAAGLYFLNANEPTSDWTVSLSFIAGAVASATAGLPGSGPSRRAT